MGYRWICRLGAGAFGEVWKAFRSEDSREYAVKLLKEPYGSAVLRRFDREKAALSSLQNPNIVACVGFMYIENRPALIMEYLAGGTLRDRLNRGKLAVSTCISIMRGVLNGLHHAHGQNYVHRDVKPENILFDGSNVPKVADFGLVKALAESTEGLTVGPVGTPGYMAPELVEDSNVSSAKVDIYSAGVTLYEMLAGRKPVYQGRSPLPPSHFNSAVNKELDAVVLKMVAEDPNHRFKDAKDAADALRPLGTVYLEWELEQERKRSESLAPPLGFAACLLILFCAAAVLSGE